MSATGFQFINYRNPAPEDLPSEFTITCPPSTDVWDKPPSTHSFNAPLLVKTLPLKSFKSARVAVSANWKDKYDQGGLCLIINPEAPADGETKKQWVKTGIEFLDGKPHVSTVATDRWSDWSLRPVPSQGGSSATIEMAMHDDHSLWVYLIEGVERTPMREVTWFGDVDQDSECWVGIYAAKPAKENYDLEVKFVHLVIETK